MSVFEYDTLDLPGTAALDPEKTLKDIGVTLTKEDIIEAGGQVVDDSDDSDEGDDTVTGGDDTVTGGDDTVTGGDDTTEGGTGGNDTING